MPRIPLRCVDEREQSHSHSYHAAKADEDSQHTGGNTCATINGCSAFSSALRPRSDCALVHQPRKTASNSRRRRLRKFRRQWLQERCLLKSSSNSTLRELPTTIEPVPASTRSFT